MQRSVEQSGGDMAYRISSSVFLSSEPPSRVSHAAGPTDERDDLLIDVHSANELKQHSALFVPEKNRWPAQIAIANKASCFC
jgi:uncharacterized protein (UPF0276 family)